MWFKTENYGVEQKESASARYRAVGGLVYYNLLASSAEWKCKENLVIKSTSLHCCWQTSTMQCLAPTVLYTDVDGQCDKRWLMTVTSLAHWPST